MTFVKTSGPPGSEPSVDPTWTIPSIFELVTVTQGVSSDVVPLLALEVRISQPAICTLSNLTPHALANTLPLPSVRPAGAAAVRRDGCHLSAGGQAGLVAREAAAPRVGAARNVRGLNWRTSHRHRMPL